MAQDTASAKVAPDAAQASLNKQSNPLLADWTGPYDGVPPFDKVSPELFPAALQAAIDAQRAEILAIADNPAPATFANTVEALEKSGDLLSRVFAPFGVMTSNMSTPAYQAIQREWGPKLAAASDEITLNPKLFQRVKAVYDARETSGLNDTQKRVVTRLYDSFVRRGANLDAAQKQQLSAYNQQLAAAFAEFSEKVLADESTFITATEAEMKGVPEDVKAAAASAAKERKLPAGTYAIVNTRSAVDPVLTFADNRALREKAWRAFVSRGDNGDANDTNATIAKIVKLRADRAKLLGFNSHAEWRMQDTMAKTPEKATELMMKVWPAAVARVKEEVRDQQAIADKEGAKIKIAPWDYRYYQEKVRKDRYNLTQDEVKPYFELNNIIDASYWAAGELYGLDFKEVTGIPAWSPDIRTWSVTDRATGKQVGLFYRDDFARTGKRSGAWATTYRSRSGLLGDDIVLGSNNNNFVKPGAGEPVLISLDDAETLFHEFGHAIHFFLSNVYYPSLGGTPRDFVEYPSQVNENWLLTPQVLSKFAKHYKTGEPMPKALLDKIEASSKFNQGFATVEYLSSALVDMALHVDPDGVVDPKAFEKETLAKLGMPSELVMRHRLPQFNHLFSSDAYSAGYYSYLWSETMDADTWAAFEETGNPFDKATAEKFKATLLSTGNETDRADAYKAFRGRDPDVNALLKKRGFPTN
ncbi:M3 family metallopeptidase [Allosphingosinicella flava]|uniref:M3 family metallopeptidase n=2 Tax=Allosphingosinicella flava TaxID=2771430 RepID=A0A7T2GLQ9_9SPHN|nr:M3 family metallopeptidase [Sphingosinicella flava]